MNITKQQLIDFGACPDGLQEFVNKFGESADYQTVLNHLADIKKPDWANWLIKKIGQTTIQTVIETDFEADFAFFAGSVIFKKSVKIKFSIFAGSGIKAGWGIKAGEGIKAGSGIKAGWGIEAGEGIKAGWRIEAGEGIKAGWGIEAGEDHGIYCGLNIRVSLKSQYALIKAKTKPRNILLGEFVKTDGGAE